MGRPSAAFCVAGAKRWRSRKEHARRLPRPGQVRRAAPEPCT